MAKNLFEDWSDEDLLAVISLLKVGCANISEYATHGLVDRSRFEPIQKAAVDEWKRRKKDV